MDWQRLQHLAGINEDTDPTTAKELKDRQYDGLDSTDVARVRTTTSQAFSQLTFGLDAVRDHLSVAKKAAVEFKKIVGGGATDSAPSKLAAFDAKVAELRDWAQKMIDDEYSGSDR